MFSEHIADIFSIHTNKTQVFRQCLQCICFFQSTDKHAGIFFYTDNKDLFQFSLEQVEPAGWHLDDFTWDLHHDETLNQGNVMTEYEQKFSSMGNPICKLIVSR